MVFVILSEIVLYLCFSILMGSFILSSIPQAYRPSLRIRKKYLFTAAMGLMLFSFVPVFLIIWKLQQRVGWEAGIQAVLFTFDIGKAWLFTAMVVVILLFFLAKFYQPEQTSYSWIGVLFTFLLIVGLAWSSHAHSLEYGKGLFIHITHFTAVTVWVGIMYVGSWFSKNHDNWLRFLRWYTPLALLCLFVTIASGIFLMTFSVDSPYPNSWMVDYGQFLLIKHILIISMLIYAVINGILIRRSLINNPNFNPVPWVKAESIIVLLVFAATAAMSHQMPPSAGTWQIQGVSVFFELFYQGNYYPGMETQFGINSLSIIFMAIALLFLYLIFYAFYKKTSPIFTFCLSVLFSFSIYLALMLSIG